MELLRDGGFTVATSNSSAFTHPIMHTFNSLLLLGSLAFQSILGRPNTLGREAAIQKRDVDSYIASQEPIAFEELLCNIGSSGCHAAGVTTGFVIASPSRSDPDYFYHWTRDAALVFKSLVDRFINSYDADLQVQIQNCVCLSRHVPVLHFLYKEFLVTENPPNSGLTRSLQISRAKHACRPSLTPQAPCPMGAAWASQNSMLTRLLSPALGAALSETGHP